MWKEGRCEGGDSVGFGFVFLCIYGVWYLGGKGNGMIWEMHGTRLEFGEGF
jgi:hypothetical protein